MALTRHSLLEALPQYRPCTWTCLFPHGNWDFVIWTQNWSNNLYMSGHGNKHGNGHGNISTATWPDWPGTLSTRQPQTFWLMLIISITPTRVFSEDSFLTISELDIPSRKSLEDINFFIFCWKFEPLNSSPIICMEHTFFSFYPWKCSSRTSQFN